MSPPVPGRAAGVRPDVRPAGVEVVRTGPAFDALGADWDALYRRAARAWPFLCHAWLAAYWQAFGDADSLRVVCVRDAERRLVAAAPLRLHRHLGVTALSLLAGEVSDFTDVLIHPGVPGAAQGLVAALLDLAGWDTLDAPEVPPGSALAELLASWPGPSLAVPASTCLELPAAPVEPLLAGLPGRVRGELRRRFRQADTLGLRCAEVPPDEAEIAIAVGELLDLHARQWAGRPVNPTHLTGRFRRHLTTAAQRMVPAGRAALTRYHLGGSVAAGSPFLLTEDTVGGYLYGVDPALRAQVDVSAVMVRSGLELGSARGATRLNMLRGAEPAKLRWQPRATRNQRLLLLPPGTARGCLAVAGALLSGAARDALHRSPRAVRLAHQIRRRQPAG